MADSPTQVLLATWCGLCHNPSRDRTPNPCSARLRSRGAIRGDHGRTPPGCRRGGGKAMGTGAAAPLGDPALPPPPLEAVRGGSGQIAAVRHGPAPPPPGPGPGPGGSIPATSRPVPWAILGAARTRPPRGGPGLPHRSRGRHSRRRHSRGYGPIAPNPTTRNPTTRNPTTRWAGGLANHPRFSPRMSSARPPDPALSPASSMAS